MKVLVTAASKHGAPQEIGVAIGATLQRRGLEVTVSPAEEVISVEGYDAAVVGSGVYAGQWLKPAKELVESDVALLNHLPVWLFSSGPIGDPPKPEEIAVDVAAIVEAVKPRDHRLFAGKLTKSELGFTERAVVSRSVPRRETSGTGKKSTSGRPRSPTNSFPEDPVRASISVPAGQKPTPERGFYLRRTL